MAISDKGMVHLAGLSDLEEITVGGPDLTDAGLTSLAEMHKLRYLHLNGGTFTDAGLRHLAGLESLRNLRVDGEVAFSSAALQNLRRQLLQLLEIKINEESEGGIGGGIAP